MSTTALLQEPRRSRAVTTDDLSPDLEWFWPSRRGHAYDEFCC